MDNLAYLRDIVVILGFAIVIVTVFHRFKLPSIAGFILAGILVGPQGLGLVNDVHQVEILAEVGVALLLFGIGLELSLEKLRRLWKLILTGGFLQVGLSISVVFIISKFFGLADNTALFIGFLIALSSTAIVLRELQQRGDVDAPHGRLTLGILVFQDFSVIPMILVIPLLSSSESSAKDLLGALIWACIIIVGVLFGARIIIPRILNVIARTRQRHLFIMAVFTICIGTAWLISSAGVSLAIGAFLAGLIVAESEYRHQALADLIPFREVFASLFFVSIGMLLIPSIIIENYFLILMLLTAIIVGKFIIVFITAAIIRLPLRVCLLAAVALTQVGEFSLVLSYAAKGTGLLDKSLEINLISAVILSMFITPFAIPFGPRLAAVAGRLRIFTRLFKTAIDEGAVDKIQTIHSHIIVGGYGFAGQELAQTLDECDIPYVIVDLNIDNVRKAGRKGRHAYFGDVTNHEVLEHLRAGYAKELVLLINDPGAAERAVKVARSLAPNLYIVVRTQYMLDIKPLLAAGANDVISAEQEAAVEVASRLLNRHQVESPQIAKRCSQIRNRHN
ncbi:MAG: cation:proton antiporter [candidate division Zixibacteria bacterium]|nr:cation:proton antiporter [candidate division Zixibacteria bacterium]